MNTPPDTGALLFPLHTLHKHKYSVVNPPLGARGFRQGFAFIVAFIEFFVSTNMQNSHEQNSSNLNSEAKFSQ